MTVAAKDRYTRPCAAAWHRALAQVAAHAQAQGAHPARTVVRCPYAQLMPWAQRFLGAAVRRGLHRVLSTQLAGHGAGLNTGDDFAGDVARDTPDGAGVARAMAGRGALRDLLAAL